MIEGIESDIIAIKQVDNLTILQTPATEIIVHKSIDEITIGQFESIMGALSSIAADDVRAAFQVDNIIITRTPDIEITIVD